MGFVAGVEVVTVLLLSFAFIFGVRCGVLTAVSFSVLRCFLWGFYPSVIILYLIYFPLFAFLFGLLGKMKDEVFDGAPVWLNLFVNLVLLSIITACACCLAFNLIKISRLYKTTVTILLWAIALLCTGLWAAFNVLYTLQKAGKIQSGKTLKLFFITVTASLCTISFSLLDDVISPLFYGMSRQAALVYFYGSFMAMLPQTVCTIVTVSTLFYPLTKIFSYFGNNGRKKQRLLDDPFAPDDADDVP